MKQITEDYVSNEVGKLLEEKGFDWQQSPFYSEQDMDKWKQENSYQIPNPDYDPNIPFDTETITVVAPHISQSLALKWLREVYNIVVVIFPIRNVKGKCCYNVSLYNTNAEHKKTMNKDYQTHEQAVEAALKYTLENLI